MNITPSCFYFSYSNSPFHSDNSKYAKIDQEILRNSSHGDPLPNIEVRKEGKKGKKLYWNKEDPKENNERIEREKETRKEKRERIQKEHNDGKIAHRIYVLRERLRILDSEATIVRKEIRRLESKQSPPSE